MHADRDGASATESLQGHALGLDAKACLGMIEHGNRLTNKQVAGLVHGMRRAACLNSEGALTGGGDTGGTNKNIPAADTQTSTSDSSSTTTKKPKATQPKKAKSTKGQVLLEDSGHGQKQTQSFTAKGDWDLAYKWGSCGGVDIFQMYIYDGDGVPTGVGANTQKSSGQDVTHQHQGGEHYIEVNTACDWSLKVTSAE